MYSLSQLIGLTKWYFFLNLSHQECIIFAHHWHMSHGVNVSPVIDDIVCYKIDSLKIMHIEYQNDRSI